jgi:hypothetical protein
MPNPAQAPAKAIQRPDFSNGVSSSKARITAQRAIVTMQVTEASAIKIRVNRNSPMLVANTSPA